MNDPSGGRAWYRLHFPTILVLLLVFGVLSLGHLECERPATDAELRLIHVSRSPQTQVEAASVNSRAIRQWTVYSQGWPLRYLRLAVGSDADGYAVTDSPGVPADQGWLWEISDPLFPTRFCNERGTWPVRFVAHFLKAPGFWLDVVIALLISVTLATSTELWVRGRKPAALGVFSGLLAVSAVLWANLPQQRLLDRAEQERILPDSKKYLAEDGVGKTRSRGWPVVFHECSSVNTPKTFCMLPEYFSVGAMLVNLLAFLVALVGVPLVVARLARPLAGRGASG